LRFIVDESFCEDSAHEVFCAENFMRNRICQRTDGGLDWTWFRDNGAPGIRLHVLDGWSTLVLSHFSTFPIFLKHECGCAFNYSMLAHEACVFHAGVGKTTHTRMWRDHENALILNGDRCLCRKVGGTWYAYGMPWCGSSGEYINRRVPITCIVQLCRGTSNMVKSISAFDATVYLLQRIFAPVWEPNLREKAVDICQEFGCNFPVFQLTCRPDLESVQVLKQAIIEL
jgi:hypothetical protein